MQMTEHESQTKAYTYALDKISLKERFPKKKQLKK